MFTMLKNTQWRHTLIGTLVVLIAVTGIASLEIVGEEILVEKKVRSENGMVVAATPQASEAGADILKKGGNAVDAAVATAFALGVAEPHASGLGAGGFMIIDMADSNEPVAIEYRHAAPEESRIDMYEIGGPGLPGYFEGPENEEEQDQLRYVGASSIGVPRTLAGLTTALEKHGTMSLKEVLQPAIRLAEEGIRVDETLHSIITDNYDKITSYPETAEIYLKDGLVPEVGDTIVQKDLANTLEKIAENGPEVFYEGELADTIVDYLQRNGGFITKDDLATAKARTYEPVTSTYRDYKIVTMPPPSSAMTIQLILNILEGYDVKELGLPAESAKAFHIISEAQKLGFANRYDYLADQRYTNIPFKGFLSKDFAEEQRKRISPDEAAIWPSEGEPDKYETTHLSVADKAGNIVSMTNTQVYFFGSGVTIPGTGILMNNGMCSFTYEPGIGPPPVNAIAPGKVPRSNMSPMILYKDGQPSFVLGSTGSTRINSTLVNVINNIVDYDMTLEEAINAPRFYAYSKTVRLESRISEKVREKLKEKGHPLSVKGDFDLYFGGVHAIQITREDGEKIYIGVADPRRSGEAAGY